MKPGPLDLIEELDAPEVIYSNSGIQVARATGVKGSLYEVTPSNRATAAELADGFAHIPPNAVVRDAFSDEGEVCINFWDAA
ncbi:hypothetical protein Ssi03_13480 [Sphaerisporangium siamense]|uniref:Uncharacterized protein n=1 Tax=Sphaerisporangium siamense TaxID=795645 RepID=A0A7W7D9R4_9ACTN|nr:hypothetical protein [Sphaerisporangium siamense]MBB4702883.1 hypothetical protein [Sphaerisporangium siamense]GII83358.1 hypothetical protein Ssi03_13480 [Sphaerisporangium siamense]